MSDDVYISGTPNTFPTASLAAFYLKNVADEERAEYHEYGKARGGYLIFYVVHCAAVIYGACARQELTVPCPYRRDYFGKLYDRREQCAYPHPEQRAFAALDERRGDADYVALPRACPRARVSLRGGRRAAAHSSAAREEYPCELARSAKRIKPQQHREVSATRKYHNAQHGDGRVCCPSENTAHFLSCLSVLIVITA